MSFVYLFVLVSLSQEEPQQMFSSKSFFLFADKHCRPLAELHYQSTVWSAGSMADQQTRSLLHLE